MVMTREPFIEFGKSPVGLQSIKELGKELKRIHHLLERTDSDLMVGIDGREILIKKMGEIEDCLMEISRMHNGLEY